MKRTKTDRSHYLFDNQTLAALIVPLIIEQLLAVLVGMADSIMVASVGEAAVSGVSLVDNIMVLLINIFSALATGGAVVAGQYLGQKRKEEACKSSTQLVWFITILAAVITAIVYLCRDLILHGVFGAIEADVMGHANIYLLIVGGIYPIHGIIQRRGGDFPHDGQFPYTDARIHCYEYHDVGVKRYFDPYDTRIVSHFMLSQS